MQARIHCITLPVDHLASTILFYRDGLGLEWEDKDDHAVFFLEGQLMLMALPREQFAGFTDMVGQRVASAGSSEMILSYFAASEDEVDTILERAVDYASGGEAAEQRAWGYSGYLTDPDGHIWEILFNPVLPAGIVEEE